MPKTITARSIPACAGEPSRRTARWRMRRVYPRVCGGTLASGQTIVVGDGLSPRVRGNLTIMTITAIAFGSIPACAGEPVLSKQGRVHIPVYPRVCGGTKCYCAYGKLHRGLSPRVRGNPFVLPVIRFA